MQALQFEPTSHIVAGGALATLSGAKTGRTWVATLVAVGVCSCCSSGRRCPVGRHQGEQQGQAVCCLRPQFSSIPWWRQISLNLLAPPLPTSSCAGRATSALCGRRAARATSGGGRAPPILRWMSGETGRHHWAKGRRASLTLAGPACQPGRACSLKHPPLLCACLPVCLPRCSLP